MSRWGLIGMHFSLFNVRRSFTSSLHHLESSLEGRNGEKTEVLLLEKFLCYCTMIFRLAKSNDFSLCAFSGRKEKIKLYSTVHEELKSCWNLYERRAVDKVTVRLLGNISIRLLGCSNVKKLKQRFNCRKRVQKFLRLALSYSDCYLQQVKRITKLD